MDRNMSLDSLPIIPEKGDSSLALYNLAQIQSSGFHNPLAKSRNTNSFARDYQTQSYA